MTTAVTIILLAFALVNCASARPYPVQEMSSLDKDAIIEFVNSLARLKEYDDELDTQSLDDQIAEEERWDEDEDLPPFNEEQINEKNGVAKLPDMFGDLLLTKEQEALLLGGKATEQGFLYTAKRWTSGVIPYHLDANLNSKARTAISEAIKEIHKRTCIKLVPRTSDNVKTYPNYVLFTPDKGCYSYLGMIGGRQKISIGKGCENKAIVQHEILHALGRIHEQSRPDRDCYVKINTENIKKGKEHNFKKMQADTSGLPYDYQSVMHYSAYAFSSNGKPTIVPLHTSLSGIGQRKSLSSTDWEHIEKAYCSSTDAESMNEDREGDFTYYDDSFVNEQQ